MTQDGRKMKEYWIAPERLGGIDDGDEDLIAVRNLKELSKPYDNVVHVIEYSAYEKLKNALEEIKDDMIGGFVNEDGREYSGEPSRPALIACEALGLEWEIRNASLPSGELKNKSLDQIRDESAIDYAIKRNCHPANSSVDLEHSRYDFRNGFAACQSLTIDRREVLKLVEAHRKADENLAGRDLTVDDILIGLKPVRDALEAFFQKYPEMR